MQGGLAFQEVGLTDPGQLGGLLALASLGVPAGGLLFGFLSIRLAIGRVLGAMRAILGAGTAAIGLAGTVRLMVAASVLQQVGAGMCVASLLYWVSKILPPEKRGRGFGLWSTAFFLGQFLSPALAGPLHAAFGAIRPVFMLFGLLGLAGGVVMILTNRSTSDPIA